MKNISLKNNFSRWTFFFRFFLELLIIKTNDNNYKYDGDDVACVGEDNVDGDGGGHCNSVNDDDYG